MTSRSRSALPRRISIKEVLKSRYEQGSRPVSWDQRKAGIDVVKTDQGETIELFSPGGQSSPACGWELLLIRESSESNGAFEWTLYGIPSQANS